MASDMAMRIALLGLFVVGTAVGRGAGGNALSEGVHEWVRVPEPTADDLICANWTLRSWRLRPDGHEEPAVVPNDDMVPRRDWLPFPFECPYESEDIPARRVATRLMDRWLVGCDLGERGGA